jgi:hypothetical protein
MGQKMSQFASVVFQSVDSEHESYDSHVSRELQHEISHASPHEISQRDSQRDSQRNSQLDSQREEKLDEPHCGPPCNWFVENAHSATLGPFSCDCPQADTVECAAGTFFVEANEFGYSFRVFRSSSVPLLTAVFIRPSNPSAEFHPSGLQLLPPEDDGESYIPKASLERIVKKHGWESGFYFSFMYLEVRPPMGTQSGIQSDTQDVKLADDNQANNSVAALTNASTASSVHLETCRETRDIQTGYIQTEDAKDIYSARPRRNRKRPRRYSDVWRRN